MSASWHQLARKQVGMVKNMTAISAKELGFKTNRSLGFK
jgi:hypothetical protein